MGKPVTADALTRARRIRAYITVLAEKGASLDFLDAWTAEQIGGIEQQARAEALVEADHEIRTIYCAGEECETPGHCGALDRARACIRALAAWQEVAKQ